MRQKVRQLLGLNKEVQHDVIVKSWPPDGRGLKPFWLIDPAHLKVHVESRFWRGYWFGVVMVVSLNVIQELVRIFL